MRIKRFVIILLSILSGVSFGVALVSFLLSNGYLNSNYKIFVVQSGSMEPALKVGSLILTKSQSEYAVGDVVTFNKGKQIITHRINAINYLENNFITKGDANEEADTATINSSQIIGTTKFAIPYLGYLSGFVRTPKGFVALVIIPASIIIYEEIKKILGEIKRFFSKIRLLRFARNDKGDVIARPKAAAIFRPTLAALIPIMGVFLLFIGASVSYFHDNENSNGNVLSAGEWEGDFTARTLVINEVLPDSSCFIGQTEAQFIEIYNGFNVEVSLKDFQITDGNNVIDLVTAANIIVPPGGLALLSHNSATWQHCYDDNNVITANLGGQLDIDTGFLQLLDAGDNIIDTVIWGDSPLEPTQDNSIEREPKGWDTKFGEFFEVNDFKVNVGNTSGL